MDQNFVATTKIKNFFNSELPLKNSQRFALKKKKKTENFRFSSVIGSLRISAFRISDREKMKTESEAIPPATLPGEVRSVSEIVSGLRAAFRTVDFDRAEAVLVARETALRREIARQEEEKQSIMELRELDRIELADLHARLERGAEAAPPVPELEAARARATAAEKLLEEKESEVSDLKRRLREAEAEAERWKRSYDEMDARVATVEADTVGLLMTGHSPAARKAASKRSESAGGSGSSRNAGKVQGF